MWDLTPRRKVKADRGRRPRKAPERVLRDGCGREGFGARQGGGRPGGAVRGAEGALSLCGADRAGDGDTVSVARRTAVRDCAHHIGTPKPKGTIMKRAGQPRRSRLRRQPCSRRWTKGPGVLDRETGSRQQRHERTKLNSHHEGTKTRRTFCLRALREKFLFVPSCLRGDSFWFSAPLCLCGKSFFRPSGTKCRGRNP